MRDQHDTTTDDLVPAKRGRPCTRPELGPLSDAERARAYRAKRKQAARKAALVAISVEHNPNSARTRESLDALTTPAMVDALRERIAMGDRQNAMLVLRLIAGRVQMME